MFAVMDWSIWEILFYLLLAISLQTAIGVLMERRDPVSTIAWLIVLVALPVVGFPIYFLFGRRAIRKKIARSVSASRHVAEETRKATYPEPTACNSDGLPPGQRSVSNLIRGLGGSSLRERIHITVLQDGPETFDAMVAAIDAAEHYVHFEYFIFNPGDISARLRDALVAAANRGVEVRMMFDAFGSYKLPVSFIQPILDAGGRYADFNPVRWNRLRRRPDFRNHRKIQVVDGLVGFVGGINVMDEYLASSDADTPWRDTHLRLEGAVVHDLERCLMETWSHCTEEVLAGPEHFARISLKGSAYAQIVAGGPDDRWTHIEKAYNTAIYAAERRINVATPYFIPSHMVVGALVSAALRGVHVRMLVPAQSDSKIVEWAARSYFPDLTEAGIEVYEYGPRMMHAKTLTVDGRFCAVGTPNLDLRSFRLNYEVSAFLFDTDATEEVDRALDEDFAAAKLVEFTSEEKRPLLLRLKENSARLLSPLL